LTNQSNRLSRALSRNICLYFLLPLTSFLFIVQRGMKAETIQGLLLKPYSLQLQQNAGPTKVLIDGAAPDPVRLAAY
jgi:hypothetical protein